MSQLTSLFLAPVKAQSTPSIAAIRQILGELEVIAAPLGPETYAAGAGFSRQVIYAGCSPNLAMHPPEEGGRQFCHVALHGPFARPRLVTGPNTVKPRCPRCRARYPDWRDRLGAWQTGSEQAQCLSCGHSSAPCELDWRRHAICACILVELRNVFPGEAIPGDQLMHGLESRTGEEWQYAWAGLLDEDADSLDSRPL
jgi:hypothetical protein